jgi:predicted transposase YdaD
MKTYNKSILEYNDVMNSVQYAEERGEQRGISIGEQRKVAEFVIKYHGKGMSVGDIADLTDLSIEDVTDFINTYS